MGTGTGTGMGAGLGGLGMSLSPAWCRAGMASGSRREEGSAHLQAGACSPLGNTKIPVPAPRELSPEEAPCWRERGHGPRSGASHVSCSNLLGEAAGLAPIS